MNDNSDKRHKILNIKQIAMRELFLRVLSEHKIVNFY